MLLVYNIYVTYTVMYICTHVYIHVLSGLYLSRHGRVCKSPGFAGSSWEIDGTSLPTTEATSLLSPGCGRWKSVDGLVWRLKQKWKVWVQDFRNPNVVEIVWISSGVPWRLFFRLLFLFSPNNYRNRWQNRHVQMALWQEYQCILWGDLMIVAYHSALWWYYVSIE